jgi:cold shock CspA family protein
MSEGTVQWFDTKKSYGFIVPDREAAKDIFVHISQLERVVWRRVFNGQRIAFEPYDDHGRTVAESLKIIEEGKASRNS